MKWHTEKRKINDLIPYEHNPRQMTEKQVEDLKKSLEKFDLVEIPAINTDNMILAGHQRLKIMQLLGRGEEEIDVRVPDRLLDKKEVQEYNIRSNKNTGEWNFDELANSFDTQELIDWGFDEKDLKIDMPVEEDEAPEVQEEAVSKLGDIYQLGNHRLLCGDATKIEDVEKLMNGQKADMVFTDPPYSVNYTKKAKEVLKSKNYVEIENDDMSVQDTSDKLWRPVFKNMYDAANDDCSVYLTMPQGGDQMMMMMMMSENWQVKHELIWVKEAPVFSMGRLDYDYKHEPILYGWKKKHNFYGKGQYTKSVWEIPRTENKLHPTMKPVALIANCLANSTLDNQNILDLFGGSGSTLIACEQLNRKCYMMELDPRYVDVIIKRWENYTGQKAVKL
jgi:DNA modification methylase